MSRQSKIAPSSAVRDPSSVAEPQDELLEVYDQQERKLGLRTRGEIHRDASLIHRAVHVMVTNSGGEVFLQKRSMAKMIQPGKWDTSVGGHVDPGETYEAAAVREMEEELGIVMPDVGALRHLHDYTWRTEAETELVRWFALVWDGEIRFNTVEIDEGRFWTEQQLREVAGSGILTSNLEKELRLWGILR